MPNFTLCKAVQRAILESLRGQIPPTGFMFDTPAMTTVMTAVCFCRSCDPQVWLRKAQQLVEIWGPQRCVKRAPQGSEPAGRRSTLPHLMKSVKAAAETVFIFFLWLNVGDAPGVERQ